MNSTQSEQQFRPMTVRLALQLAAPHTWAASLCPALFAAAFCLLRNLGLGVLRTFLTTAACVALQSAVNTLNDYVDFVRGTDSAEDNVAENDAALVYGGIDPRSARNLGLGYLASGLLLGLLACWGRGWVPILVGAFGAAAVLLYSGGPLPVSYLPVGEAVSGFVMGGLIPLGVAACADGFLHPEILPWSLPLILGIGLVMMSNNGCDIEKDRRARRNTLPALLGRERTLHLYRGLIALWLALLAALPVILAGWIGLACPALVLLGGRDCFRKLFHLKLLPETRIAQMRCIAGANVRGNGAYIAALLAASLIRGFYG